jgi:hypothetical protein
LRPPLTAVDELPRVWQVLQALAFIVYRRLTMKAPDLSLALIQPMTDGHARAVLAIYQASIDKGNATSETQIPAWEAFRLPAFPTTGLLLPTAISFLAGGTPS